MSFLKGIQVPESILEGSDELKATGGMMCLVCLSVPTGIKQKRGLCVSCPFQIRAWIHLNGQGGEDSLI